MKRIVSVLLLLSIILGKLHKKIIEEFKSLENYPRRYPWLNAPEFTSNKCRKKLAADRYLLIYQIRDNDVLIDYILDCRQDYRWLVYR